LAKKFKTAAGTAFQNRGTMQPPPAPSALSTPRVSSAQRPLLAQARPSHTALLCGIARARHQVLDGGEIFHDPLAFDILGPAQAAQVRAALAAGAPTSRGKNAGSFSQAMRGALVVRSRIAEDTLREAVVAGGATQYVLLGAGLDTFALRNQWPQGLERVFEVDHPATQAWKQDLASQAGLSMPPGANYVPVDFERQDFLEQLAAHGFHAAEPTVFAWLGVTMYLPPAAVEATLSRIGARAAPGSVLVFDYVRTPEPVQWGRKLGLALMGRRFRRMGEPWRCTLRDAELHAMLAAHGFEPAEIITPDRIRNTLLAHRPATLWQRALGGLLGGIVRVRVAARGGRLPA
jgi:methyltransferase (TIGR00027 family)